ncbi:MAG: TonB-dependent receptor [Muribaculaceae bacterium]|nr:TonB-dependent receptor [Muribaculaceae bacterium]
MNQKLLSLSMAFTCISSAMAAQYSGVVLDSDRQPLEFANVALLHPQDSTLIAGGMTDSSGSFSIGTKERPVIVRISYPGYSPLYIESSDDNVGTLEMSGGTLLGEVTVTANGGRLISQKVDRLVYNVENDPFAINKTAIQLLEQTPRIMVNQKESTLSMIGRDGVGVMIDGRMLSTEESRSFLSNLRSDEISSIEVIPIPPAKYDSEGNIGLVNIRLRPNPSLGFQGNMSLNYDQGYRDSWYPSATFNWQKSKWSSRIGLSPHFIGGKQNSSEIFEADTYRYERTSRMEADIKDYAANAIIKVTPSSKVELGTIIEGGVEDNRFTSMLFSGTDIQSSINNTYQMSTPRNHRVNVAVYGDIRLDESGKNLTITYNSHFRKRKINDLFQAITSVESDLSSKGMYYYRTNSLLADFALPFSFARIETGISGQMVDNSTSLNSEWSPEDRSNSRYRYDENIYSAYVSASRPIGDAVYGKIGVRYEYTQVKGHSLDSDESSTSNYGNLFPSAFVIWNVNNDNALSLNYAYRIQRPFFEDLNPFVRYYDFNNFHQGNPNLRPSKSHNLELNYSYKGNLNVTLWGNAVNHNIEYIPLLLENGDQTQLALNASNIRKGGVSVSYYISPVEWMSVSAQVSGFYNHSHCYIPELNISDMDGWGGNFNLYANFFMNRSKSMRGGISYWQTLPSYDGLQKSNGIGSLNIDYSYSLLKDKLVLSAGANDIFNQNISKTKRFYQDYNYKSITNGFQRSFWIGVTWKFGKKTVDDVDGYAKDVLGGRGI